MNELRAIQDVVRIKEYLTEIAETKERFGDKESFMSDKDYQKSIVMSLEQIGEIVKRLPMAYLEDYPDIPWNEMRGLRNKITHEYGKIDFSEIWQILYTDLEKLDNDLTILIKKEEKKIQK